MTGPHGPINVNVNVSQSQSQFQQQSDRGGCLGCLGVLGALMLLGTVARLFEAAPALGVVLVALVVMGIVAAVVKARDASRSAERAEAAERAETERAAAVRADIESRATVDVFGGCMWCGLRDAHRGESGHPVHPGDWHALEVEAAVAASINGQRPDGIDSWGRRDDGPPGSGDLPIVPAPLPHRARHDAGLRRPARAGASDDLQAQLAYDPSTGECLWCGSPVPHRTEVGRVVHPARFHRDEYEAERQVRGG